MLGLPESLHQLVTRHFQAARRSKSLIFSETELAVVQSGGRVPFQLRYLPALVKKPSPKDAPQSKDKPKPDPFDDPSEDLLIVEVPISEPTHILVLNKFPVIENHFILATKSFKQQTAPLEPDDLSIAYECLQAWAKDAPASQPRRLFAFFNSGEHSGASQPHRHIQFLPFEDMAESHDEWQLLIDRMTSRVAGNPSLRQDLRLPFLHYATELSPGVSAHELHLKYISLLRAAVSGSTKQDMETMDEVSEHPNQNGETLISYNLAMTTETMAIMPRRSDESSFPGVDSTTGSVAINGTILGGTLMVKHRHEYQSLRESPHLLDSILINIGFPVSGSSELDQTKL